ncbi:MAG TPA: PilT/PilU family type 4a pilus ATPase [Acidimicrobiales bacterium]|nr:PilT/PilU family type 4a pilus ATPase [Acidimicrobiales bacterium]
MAHDWLDALLTTLDAVDGSDLHLKAGSPPRIRVHGRLQAVGGEGVVVPAVTAEVAAAIMAPEVHDRFSELHEADFAYSVAGLARFRVNAYSQRNTVGLVFRRVRTTVPGFEELGLPPALARLAGEPRGLVVVTGPTGSGKTTTLGAMIDLINRTRECNIVTIEDPVEILHADRMASISQREIGTDTNSFAVAMRAAMRQDPDVILVGEMRDLETAEAALTAAETGHLVLSTLHTIDVTETVNRIVDVFPPHQHSQVRVSLAGALRGVVCQRLVPRCDGDGRVAAVEVLVSNGRVQQCILDPQKTSEIADIVAEGEFYGMQTFDQSLAALYGRGIIDLQAALASASRPHDLRVMLESGGLVATGV